MPRRICHIVHSTVGKLPPLYNELLMASREGIHSTVFQLAHGDDHAGQGVPDNVELRSIRIALRTISARQTPIMKLCRYLEFAARAFGALLFERSPVVVAHDLSALLPAWCAARLTGKSVVYNAHELYGETNEVTAPMQRAWQRLDRFLCPRVDALIAPEANRARIYREEYGAATEPLVIPNYPLYKEPVTGTRLHEYLREQGSGASRILLYQGLFDEGRCLHRIIEAMASVPEDIALVLMGRGFEEYTRRLVRLRAELRLEHRVHMHPFVPYQSLHAYSCSADAGILLYRNDCRNNYYCAPNKLYEYFQAGLPVITSNFPGLTAIVEREDFGRCVDPESPKEIAAAIASLLNDPDPAARKDRILRKARETFHWEAEFPKIRLLYESV